MKKSLYWQIVLLDCSIAFLVLYFPYFFNNDFFCSVVQDLIIVK